MKIKRNLAGLVSLMVSGWLVCPPTAPAQSGGDQILDGIGETALVARYALNGNTEDRSRNTYNAALRGDGATYVEDAKFGKVLSLPGESGGYLQVPGQALVGFDSVSVTGWVFLRSATPWQRFFDFGLNPATNFFCTPMGADAAEGYRARITISGWEEEQGPVSQAMATNQWVHLAVVLDASRRTLSTYLDGVRVGQATNVTLDLEQVLDQNAATNNLLYIGKSQYDTDSDLNALLHDFRIYSIALTDQQVATIRNNALSGEPAGAPGKESSGEGKLPGSTEASSRSAAFVLVNVPDITAETTVGVLPRLPRTIPGVYTNSAKGPEVLVIWPSPKDNHEVLETGTYILTGTVAGTKFEPKVTVTVKAAAAVPGPSRKLEAFPLGQVLLDQDEEHHDTQFIKNRDKFIRTLAETNPDRFLFNFRDAFGEKQPDGVQPLGSWDSETTRLRGHASGHYLSAIAQAYASTTYDANLHSNFLQKMNYMIDTLYVLSQKSGKPAKDGGEFNADPTTVPPGPGRTNYDSNLSAQGIRTDYWNWGKGFISAYPPDQFIMLEHGATYGGRNNQIWAPYYTLHKILAGLLDCYEVGGNQRALEIAQGMGNWVYQRLKVLPEATRSNMWSRYIAGEYGGMNEVMARLSRINGDKQFLECARLFDNTGFFFGDTRHTQGLAMNVDTLRGRHANQHIPQITGALETYRDSQDIQYYEVADNFWDICTRSYMYSIGGVAGASRPNNAECFTAEPDSLFENGFARGGQNETCATYNMLKLSRQLFMFDEETKYMDYYEQALYNDILASVAENNAGNTYHIPLNPAARKSFGNADMGGFTCCNGTALESNTKLQDSIYFRSADDQALFVNLYVPSTLTWKERNVVVKQRTDFPYADTTKLTLTGSGDFDIKVRVPKWATRGFFVKINGQEQSVDAVPGTYLTLRKTWKDNDTIELRMPFHFYLSRVMDQPNIASIFYGPVLLAAQESGPQSDWRPVTLNADDIGKSITGDPGTLQFSVNGVPFKPFYASYGRYSVYLNVTLE
jgi:uncharacterized protein